MPPPMINCWKPTKIIISPSYRKVLIILTWSRESLLIYLGSYVESTLKVEQISFYINHTNKLI